MRVEIDGIHIEVSARGFTYTGIHSGDELRGMELKFVSRSESEDSQIETLLNKRDTVTVSDPFVGRQYEATIGREWSSIHQRGQSAKYYQFEVREMDRAKTFTSLQIEGETFTVLKNSERTDADDNIVAEVLLRLSPEEFVTLWDIVSERDTMNILREGVDKNPIERCFGKPASWSRHEESGQSYYRQLVTLYNTDVPVTKGIIASAQEHRALSEMVVALTVRFEALLETLEGNGQVNEDQATRIRQEQWKELADIRRKTMIWAQLYEVDDAEEEFAHQSRL